VLFVAGMDVQGNLEALRGQAWQALVAAEFVGLLAVLPALELDAPIRPAPARHSGKRPGGRVRHGEPLVEHDRLEQGPPRDAGAGDLARGRAYVQADRVEMVVAFQVQAGFPARVPELRVTRVLIDVHGATDARAELAMSQVAVDVDEQRRRSGNFLELGKGPAACSAAIPSNQGSLVSEAKTLGDVPEESQVDRIIQRAGIAVCIHA